MENKYRLAVVVGHSKELPGAKGVAPIGTHEYFYNRALANFMKGHASDNDCMLNIFLRDNLTIRMTYLEVAKWKPDCVMELHFNAANELARGTETLYGEENPHSEEFAKIVQAGMCTLLKREGKLNRGIKKLSEGDRGFSSVNAVKCPSILIEPFFGDEVEDAKLGFQYQESLASQLVEGMIQFLIGLNV